VDTPQSKDDTTRKRCAITPDGTLATELRNPSKTSLDVLNPKNSTREARPERGNRISPLIGRNEQIFETKGFGGLANVATSTSLFINPASTDANLIPIGPENDSATSIYGYFGIKAWQYSVRASYVWSPTCGNAITVTSSTGRNLNKELNRFPVPSSPGNSTIFMVFGLLTPGSPSKFMMAAFVRVFAQKVTAKTCPVQPIVLLCYPQR